MGSQLILPDTNIIIYSLADQKPYSQHFATWIKQDRLVFSPITIAEFLIKATSTEAAKFKQLLDNFPTLAIDRQTALTASNIRKKSLKRKTKLNLADCFIAAQCKLNSLTLATLNHTDYPKEEIQILSSF